jgi:hypothetical protein
MKSSTKTLRFLGYCLAALLAFNVVFWLVETPNEAVREQIRNMGFKDHDVVVVSGKYSTTMLSTSSSLHFRSLSQPEYGEIIVEVRKATPFHPWQLSKYEFQNE